MQKSENGVPPKVTNILGQKFNRLRVVKFIRIDNKYKRAIWECVCDCGNVVYTCTNYLKNNSVGSCGCSRKGKVCSSRKDVCGQRFGLLTTIEYTRDKNKSYYLCRCDCGRSKKVRQDHLVEGRVVSCGPGCMMRVRPSKHKQSDNPLYFVWASMMDRCYRKSFSDYHNYGGRGIIVCDEWHDVIRFVEDMSDGYEKGLQLDRVDNNSNYSKENCRWATRKENNRNKRNNLWLTVNGVSKIVLEWSEITGIPRTSISARMKRGLTGIDALYGVNNRRADLC